MGGGHQAEQIVYDDVELLAEARNNTTELTAVAEAHNFLPDGTVVWI
jgi:hypothetical protein